MKHPLFKVLLLCVYFLALSSCHKIVSSSDDDTIILPSDYLTGIFIVNQGNADSGVSGKLGSISFIDDDNNNASVQDVYEISNNSTNTTTLFSMSTYQNRGYIISPDNNKIDVVKLDDFSYLGSIYGLKHPRYLQALGENKAWITQWGVDGVTGSIAVVDLATNSIINEIPTRKGPEQMFRVGDMMYVSNTGGFHMDSVISKVNIATEAVEQTIVVGERPQSFQIDRNGALWILSRGEKNFGVPELSIPGTLSKLENDNVVQQVSLSPSAGNLCINNDKELLYYTMNDGVYKHGISQGAVNIAPFISFPYVNIAVDPKTDNIIGANAGNFFSNGEVIIHSPSGEILQEHEVGVIPINFHVKID